MFLKTKLPEVSAAVWSLCFAVVAGHPAISVAQLNSIPE